MKEHMIRFDCPHCWMKIRTDDKYIGSRGRCPKCRRIVTVPDSAQAVETQLASELYSDLYGKKAADNTSSENIVPKEDFVESAVCRIICPTFDELSLFTTSVSMLLIIFLEDSFHQLIYKCYKLWTNDTLYHLKLISVLLFAAVVIFPFFFKGLFLSIFHAFTKSDKEEDDKKCMAYFGAWSNGIIGLAAGVYLFMNCPSWLLIFPFINILNGFQLIFLTKNANDVLDDDVNFQTVLVSTAVLFVLFLLCRYVFDLYWAITASICLFYATTAGEYFTKLFGSNPLKMDK
jgi:TRAP-type uncharacterized transport system fused permease subunit